MPHFSSNEPVYGNATILASPKSSTSKGDSIETLKSEPKSRLAYSDRLDKGKDNLF